MLTTSNLGLKKPEYSDVTDIKDLNDNSDIIDTAVGGKVDKVAGKQLSTEDYSTAEKTKLAGVATGANNYVHPVNHSPTIITQDVNNRFVTDAEKAVWNAKYTKAEVNGMIDPINQKLDQDVRTTAKPTFSMVISPEIQNGNKFSKSLGNISTLANTPNQKFDINFSAPFRGYFDVSVTGTWVGQDNSGLVRKRFAIFTNEGFVHSQETRYEEEIGNIGKFVSISDIVWDTTKNKFQIKIAYQYNSAYTEALTVHVEGLSADPASISGVMNNMVLSGIYTTDTAILPRAKVGFTGDVSIGGQANFLVPTGKAPFTVNSSTVVTGMNVEMLNGLRSSDFYKFGTLGQITNADTITTNGIHRVTDTFTGSPFTGQNGSNQGYLEHMNWGDNSVYCLQRHTPINSNIATRYRNKVNGTWQPWKTIWDSGNDGAGSGLDADTIRSYQTSIAPEGNTVVVRNSGNWIETDGVDFFGTGQFMNLHGNTTKIPDLNADMVDNLHATDLMQVGIAPSDINNAIVSGTYRLLGEASHTNAPPHNTYGNLLVLRTLDTITQVSFPYDNGNIMYRYGAPPQAGGGGTWSPWLKIWNEGNDGVGSKLDADMLHGRLGSDYEIKNSGVVRDFNTLLTHGKYNFANDAINGPFNGFGVVDVFVSDGGTHNNSSNWIWQTIYETSSSTMYLRNKTNSSAWTPWAEFATYAATGFLPNLKTGDKTNLVAAINEVFTSASNGKSAIANAITGMNQAAGGAETFAQLATKISNISKDATATAANLLSGTSAYIGGVKTNGTMANMTSTTTRANWNNAEGDTLVHAVMPANGYYKAGDWALELSEPSLLAKNIREGTKIFNVMGTLREGKGLFVTDMSNPESVSIPNGGSTTVASKVITGLSFTPKFVVVQGGAYWAGFHRYFVVCSAGANPGYMTGHTNISVYGSIDFSVRVSLSSVSSSSCTVSVLANHDSNNPSSMSNGSYQILLVGD